MVARTVRNWPGSNANAARCSGGTAKVMATAPAASGLTRAIGSSWKRAAVDMVSVRFEVVEGFEAIEAAVHGLAGGGAERRGFGGVGRTALGAGHLLTLQRLARELD